MEGYEYCGHKVEEAILLVSQRDTVYEVLRPRIQCVVCGRTRKGGPSDFTIKLKEVDV